MSTLREFVDRLKAGPQVSATDVQPKSTSDWRQALRKPGVVQQVSVEVLQALAEPSPSETQGVYLAPEAERGAFLCFWQDGAKIRFLTEQECAQLSQLREEESPVLIYSYTRAQAIADGVLIDVSELASEVGIRYPVAMTAAVWQRYVVVPPGVTGQDETGRCWDIVWMLYCEIRQRRDSGSIVEFPVLVRNREDVEEQVTLKAVCGPGDDPQPVITIMLLHED